MKIKYERNKYKKKNCSIILCKHLKEMVINATAKWINYWQYHGSL